MERRRINFGAKEKNFLFWCGFILILICFGLMMVENYLHDERIYYLLGYYPDRRPAYQRTISYRTSDNAAEDIEPYDPHKETLEEYEWRVYLANLQQADASLYEEEIQRDEEEQKKFYEQQASDLKVAERIARKEVDEPFILYYVGSVVAVGGTAVIGCLLIRKKKK